MTTALSQYLENVRQNLKLNRSEEQEVIGELQSHIEDTLQELTQSGLSDEEASRECMSLLGSANSVARQLYEAHSQGNWRQTLMASMPHLLFGLSFALNWWHHAGWLIVLMGLVLAATVYGWWRGKPAWAFPWLGYSLLPVLAFGILLINLPAPWKLLAIPLYFPLALWWLYSVVTQATRRDWLFSSLMLLPLPIMIGWFLVVESEGVFSRVTLERVYDFAPSIGLTFLVMALSIATFIRLRQRILRIGTLGLSGILTLGIVAYSSNGRLTLPAFLVLVVVMWGLFLVPPLLERRTRNGKQPATRSAAR
ncbi:MAG: permease prefix domain 1-containing protein [Dehalococcoidales bacterium]|nr:permease prefix domain 1-containing protein [Dehalococcoidales bacterium]